VEKVQRRLAAIVAADVVGYSRLMGQDEAGTLARLKSLRREIIHPAVTRHGGSVVKTTGDGWLLEFPSAVEAVEFAVAVQREMAGEAANSRLQLRIGINVGDIIVEEDGDIYGDGVNVAARIEALANPGAICISRTVRDQIRDKLRYTLEDRGEHEVKNIARPVRVFAIAMNGPQSVPAPPSHALAVPPLTLPDKPSIAVLPFDNMSGDREQDYFADGMTEEIITGLARLRWLFVIARNSTFAYKGRPVDVKQVGRELGVHYVLEGSVRKSAARVRITGQLIDTVTGSHLWAERFDSDLSDIFDLQDRVTESVVAAIEPSLRAAEIKRSERKRPESLAAYDYVLRAWPHFHAMTREGGENADRLLREALRIEPRYPLAKALLAWLFCFRSPQGFADHQSSEAAEAVRFAREALEADSNDPEVLFCSAQAIAQFGRDPKMAMTLNDRSLSLNPNSANAWHSRGWLLVFDGWPEKAIEAFERSRRLSPFEPLGHIAACGEAVAHLFSRRFEEAIVWARRALQENGKFTMAHRALIIALVNLGRTDEVREPLAKMLALEPSLTVRRLRDRNPYQTPEHSELWFDGLLRAGVPEG
jgi:adenylate cyclase